MEKKSRSTPVAYFVAIMLCAFSLAAQAGYAGDLKASNAIDQVMERGKIRVGMDVFVPWAMKDKQGELIGFEIDVAKQLAKDMGVAVEFVPTKWSGIIPALVAGKFDVIIGGMTVTPERELKIAFTDPYYYTSQGLLANRKKCQGFTLADFNSPDVTIAARLGSTGAVAAKKTCPKAKLRLFDDEPAAVQEVRNGRVHAMIGGQPLPNHMAAESPETLMAYDDQLLKEPIAFGVRQKDQKSLDYFNAWIKRAKDNGTIDSLYDYWFKSTEWKKMLQ